MTVQTATTNLFNRPDPATVDVDEATLSPLHLVLFILALYLRADTSGVQPDAMMGEGATFPATLEDGTPYTAFVRITDNQLQVGRVREPDQPFDNRPLWDAWQAQQQIAHIDPATLLPVPA